MLISPVLHIVVGMVSRGIQVFNYNQIIQDVVELDKFILCAVIANLENAKIIAIKYKKEQDTGLPILTREESELLTMQSLIRMSTRRTLEYKLGRALYSSTVYENVIRSSICLFNDKRKDDENDSLLMLTFDKNADHELIINSKILPFLTDIRKHSVMFE
jgi:hypothetical protein